MLLLGDGGLPLLPDEILLLIFSKLNDAESLVRCLSVCRRFASLVAHSHHLTLSHLPPLPHAPTSSPSKPPLVNFLRNLIITIAKPGRHLLLLLFRRRRRNSSPPCLCESDRDPPHQPPARLLKSFPDIKSLHIRLPQQYQAPHSLIKWNAEFGTQLDSCLILGATSLQKSIINTSTTTTTTTTTIDCVPQISKEAGDDTIIINLSEEELNLRIVWTISCLVAASARHSLAKGIVSHGGDQHPALESVILSDVAGQGKLRMGTHQIRELRTNINGNDDDSNNVNNNSAEGNGGRITVPDLRVRLWYLPVMELKGTGYSMEGATLIHIRPATAAAEDEGGTLWERNDGEDLLGLRVDGEEISEEDKAWLEAAREFINMKESYIINISSF